MYKIAKKNNIIKRYEGTLYGDIFIYGILIILGIIMIYPVIYTFSLSFSDYSAVNRGEVKLLPVGISLDSYEYVLNDSRIGKAYLYTILYASLGTFFSLLFTSLIAYPLSINTFSLKKTITILLTVTMFFDGGLIPYYLTVRNLGLINTIWVMVIPGSVSAWNVIIYRTFFKGIPFSLRESAIIDGAGDLKILYKIIVPLSKPLLAVMTLFSVVGLWNDYFNALMFLHDSTMYPLQMILRSMLIKVSIKSEDTMDLYETLQVNIRTIRAATIIVAMLPVMCAYPFVQKYFTKGLLIGSIKG